MDNMKELVTVQKPIMLDGGNFGRWKEKMWHIIRKIDEDQMRGLQLKKGGLLLPC